MIRDGFTEETKVDSAIQDTLWVLMIAPYDDDDGAYRMDIPRPCERFRLRLSSLESQPAEHPLHGSQAFNLSARVPSYISARSG